MFQLEKETLDSPADSHEQPFVFVDEKSIALFELACKVAKTQVPVLINGPTGAGKEIIAKVIHESSPWADSPFIALNCAAIPASLAEDMLFGHEKGAFTGAHAVSKGFFEQASGGTLFLDEIGEMPLDLQSKLLRVLQEKQVTRVGGTSPINVNARIVAATNVNLKQAVAQKLFREDLYYRLSGFRLTQLPLNQRIKDIEPLAHVLIQKHSSRPFPRISSCAITALQSYPWPGNVRELENVICRALIMCDGAEITQADIVFDEGDDPMGATDIFNPTQTEYHNGVEQDRSEQSDMPSGASEPRSDMLISNLRNELEFQNIVAAIAVSPNRSKAAEKLGISPRTLRYKINKLRDLGMPVPAAYARV